MLLLLHRQHENYKFSKYLDHTVIKQIGSLQYFVKKRIVTINLFRTNDAAAVTQPYTRCWPPVTAAVTLRMHEVFQL
jgi:hypothetical protein